MDIKSSQKVTVFEVKENEHRKNTKTVNLSSYEGKDKDGNAVYSSWYANFVSNAYKKADSLNEKDHIILTNATVSTSYDKETKKQYINLTVFDFEKEEASDDNE